jgi:hypothetical protein
VRDKNAESQETKMISHETFNERFKKLNGESGSLSLLIVALFMVALSSLMIITDVAVVANAKRSLDHVTEAAAMRAVHTLDEANYYTGKHTILTTAIEIAAGGSYTDNRVPIDCEKGRQEAFDEFNSWFNTASNMKTMQIVSYSIDAYQCDFDVVHLESSAKVKLPFPSPFSSNNETIVKSSIMTLNEKDKGLYLFGIRIH